MGRWFDGLTRLLGTPEVPLAVACAAASMPVVCCGDSTCSNVINGGARDSLLRPGNRRVLWRPGLPRQ